MLGTSTLYNHWHTHILYDNTSHGSGHLKITLLLLARDVFRKPHKFDLQTASIGTWYGTSTTQSKLDARRHHVRYVLSSHGIKPNVFPGSNIIDMTSFFLFSSFFSSTQKVLFAPYPPKPFAPFLKKVPHVRSSYLCKPSRVACASVKCARINSCISSSPPPAFLLTPFLSLSLFPINP